MPKSVEVLRRSLWPLSFLWAAVASIRHWMFDSGFKRIERVGVPVISVGNLSVGGTGKTPMVCWLVGRLRTAGRRPAVVARGYGRAANASLNDEGMLLDGRFEALVQEQDPDRVAAARRAVAGGEVDVVVLDDAFQHRRIHRDVDIVLLDAMRPFAGGLCLPAGDLRETPAGLRRASIVVLTRADGLSDQALAVWTTKLRRTARNDDLPVLRAIHAPESVVLPGEGPEDPSVIRGRRVLLLSGIARPSSFERTVRALGAEVVDHLVRPDHHLHTQTEIDEFLARARSLDALPLSTEKDEVKFGDRRDEIGVLRIGLRFVDREPTLAELGLGSDEAAEDLRRDPPEDELAAELHR